MKPTEDLMKDHQAIENMLEIIAKIEENVKIKGHSDLDEIDEIVDFLRTFADNFHHGKEEKIYFPELIEAGMSSVNSPVAVMLFEHEVGRGHVRDIASSIEAIRSGDISATEKMVAAMQGYVNLMISHIQKENNVLFPLGNKMLPPAKQEVLTKHIHVMEENVMGEELQKKYRELLHRLSRKYLA
jgi:Uncharacterized conserved protein